MTLTAARRTAKSDLQVQRDVLAEINRDFRFKPAEVGVEVDDGVVTLTGTVSSYLKLGQAAELATSVAGVRDVANKLTVELPGTGGRDDTKIAQAVRHALEWDVIVPEERIESIVRDAVVTLKGDVDYWYQRKSAKDAVAHLAGVKSVNDHITIVPSTRTDQDIYDEIKAALYRQLPFDGIDVSVDKGAVTLMGKVDAYRTRREAEQIVWATRGVKDVHDKIAIVGTG